MATRKKYDRKTAKRKATKRKTAKPKTAKRKTAKRKATKRKTAKRKTAKRKTAKRKTAKRKTAKRKTAKRKTAKRKTVKRKTAKRKTAKRKATKRKATKRRATKRKAAKRKATKRKATKRKTAKRKTAGKTGRTARGGQKKTAGRKTVFRIDMLPADHGDCLIVTYGTGSRLSRMLIDCGTTATADRLQAWLRKLRPGISQLDLFVLTHIDADHIGGSIDFFNEGAAGLSFDDVWFNGWKHLPRRRLSAKQGEIFSTLLEDRQLPWNRWMRGKAIMVSGDALPATTLGGGMKITLLSPTVQKLQALSAVWQKELDKHGFGSDSVRKKYYRQFLAGTVPTMRNVERLANSKFDGDSSKPNGSSIAFLGEYKGKRVLFSGDAHASVLKSSIIRLLAQTGESRLKIDAFKLPHHGSRANLSADLVKLLDCKHYLVSTSGAQFKHPDGEAMARVVVHGGQRPALHFNYRTKYNEFWGTAEAQQKFGYRANYPAEGKAGITLEL